MLPPLRAWVQSLVRELRSCMQDRLAKKKKKNELNFFFKKTKKERLGGTLEI